MLYSRRDTEISEATRKTPLQRKSELLAGGGGRMGHQIHGIPRIGKMAGKLDRIFDKTKLCQGKPVLLPRLAHWEQWLKNAAIAP